VLGNGGDRSHELTVLASPSGWRLSYSQSSPNSE
jgi:hypothetical protein